MSNDPMERYIEYLTRLQRKNKDSLQNISRLKIVREVGYSYGLTRQEIESIEWRKYE